MVLKGYLPWLIWGTYNPVPKISENKMGKRSERTWPRKTHVATSCKSCFIFLHPKILENEKREAALFT